MKKIFFFLAAMALAITANAKVTTISPDAENDALRLAVHYAEDGDIIEMTEGTYVQCNNSYVAFDGKSVTVKAAEGANVVLQLQVPITLANGGKATLQGIKIDASRLTELADWYEHVIYPTDATEGKELVMDGCELYGFNINKSAIYSSSSNTLALCDVKNCYFHDNMKSCFFFEGSSIAELSVVNSTFANIATDASGYYAGIIDVRNAAAKVTVDHCTFYNCLLMNTDYAAVTMKGPQAANVVISNNIFMLPEAIDGHRAIRESVEATNCMTFNYVKDNGGIHSSVTQTNCQLNVDPKFADAANGDFALADGSPALGAATDGSDLGDPRWNVVVEPEPTTETVYFINTKKWAAVKAHAWDGKATGTEWPGLATVKEAEQIAGYDVYSFTANVGDYASIIFNNNNQGSQTPDLVWTAGKYYVVDMGWLTKEEAEAKLAAPVADIWTVAGAPASIFGTEWDPSNAANDLVKQEDGTYKWEKADLTLATSSIQFKVVKNHAWGEEYPGSNYTLSIAEAGIYTITITFNADTKEVVGTATKTGSAVVIPTIAIAGDMNGWNTTANEFVVAADELTASLTLPLEAQDYGFKIIVAGGWTSNAATITRENNTAEFTENGDNSTLIADVAGEYTFTWTYATKTLTVTYPALPVKYNVTVTAENGTVTGAGEYVEGTTATLTATPAEGYQFVNWTVGEEVVSTENPYTFTVTADIVLVANFQATEPVVELPAASVRAWAYDLALAVEGEQYTFSYKATTAALATLIFTDVDGEELATKDLGLVEAGANTVVLAADELPAGQKVNWAVKLEAGAIANIVEVTDQSRGIYDFYNMMDVLVDNNPESEYFGKIYIQMAYNGASDGATDRADVQTAGLFIYDQELNELNDPSNVGIKPTLPEGYTMGDNRNKFHRLEIDPKTGKLAYCYNVAGSPAVFAIDRANLTGAVDNLIAGIGGLNQTCALAFDADGTLYVMNLANSAGAVYKIVDGQAVAMFEPTGKFINSSMSMAADGMGGLWIAQNRGQIDVYYQLVHVTKDGELDYTVFSGNNPDNLTGSSTRGALAYDAERQLLAQGRNGKVEVYSVVYDAETGVPTLTLVASTPTVGTNIDGLAFDYAGDLYVVNSSKEKFQKFAMPTETNVCITPAASKYAFQLEGQLAETWDVTMTNLQVDDYGESIGLSADDKNTGLNVWLTIDTNGVIIPDYSSAAIVQGWSEIELPIVAGNLTKTYVDSLDTDVYSGLVIAEYEGGYLGLNLTMYYVPVPPVVVIVENATVDDQTENTGIMYMRGQWTDAESVVYPVTVEVPGFDATLAETVYDNVTVTVGGMNDEPWLGFGQGSATVTIANNLVTLKSVVSDWGGTVIDITISGNLSQGPGTALDNIAVEAKAIKMIKNGQLIIIKNGVQYNVQGQVIK